MPEPDLMLIAETSEQTPTANPTPKNQKQTNTDSTIEHLKDQMEVEIKVIRKTEESLKADAEE